MCVLFKWTVFSLCLLTFFIRIYHLCYHCHFDVAPLKTPTHAHTPTQNTQGWLRATMKNHVCGQRCWDKLVEFVRMCSDVSFGPCARVFSLWVTFKWRLKTDPTVIQCIQFPNLKIGTAFYRKIHTVPVPCDVCCVKRKHLTGNEIQSFQHTHTLENSISRTRWFGCGFA